MNEAEKAQALAFTLYTQDIAIIDAADTNDAGRSATLRRIIREWDEMRQPVKAHVLVDTRSEYHVDRPGEYITATIGE